MAPTTALTIELAPEEESYSARLLGIEDRLIDMVPAYDALYGAFRAIERRRFDDEGPGWTELAPTTQAGRERMGIGGAHPILNRNGATYRDRKGGTLRRSLTTKGAKYAVVEPLPDGLFMGTRDPVAQYHQKGTHGAGRDHSVSMPARPVVDMTEADADTFAGIIGEWLFEFNVTSSHLGDGLFVSDAMGL